jgi:hypothetical protein
MGIVEGDGRGHILGILEFSNAAFETCNGLAHDLGASFALSVIVLASIRLLCSCTLLASWLDTVAFL